MIVPDPRPLEVAQSASLTGARGYFEDFTPGQRMRHARGTTVGEVESQLLTKLALNTADSHFNEHRMQSAPYGRRLVFGLITASLVLGLASQDTAENSLAELSLDAVRFRSPVFLGDTLYALSEVLSVRDGERADAGVVRFRHRGLNQDGVVVFEGEREVLLKRRSHYPRKNRSRTE